MLYHYAISEISGLLSIQRLKILHSVSIKNMKPKSQTQKLTAKTWII